MKNPTFYETVVHSKEWKAWSEYLHQEALQDRLHYDLGESVECGWLSENHWNAFIKFTKQDINKYMTSIEKVLAEFDERSKEIGDLIIGCYECGETINRESIRDFLTTKITQTIAEERARVLELIKSRKPNEYAVRNYKTVEARTWAEKNLVIEALDDLLSSIDIEINTN